METFKKTNLHFPYWLLINTIWSEYVDVEFSDHGIAKMLFSLLSDTWYHLILLFDWKAYFLVSFLFNLNFFLYYDSNIEKYYSCWDKFRLPRGLCRFILKKYLTRGPLDHFRSSYQEENNQQSVRRTTTKKT